MPVPLVAVRIGERVIQVSPEKAAQIRAKQAENRRNDRRIDSELRQAHMVPSSYRNILCRVKSEGSCSERTQEINNVQSWKQQKANHIRKEAAKGYDRSGRSRRLDRMHEAFERLCA